MRVKKPKKSLLPINKKVKTKLKEKNNFEQFINENIDTVTPREMIGISDDQITALYDEAIQYLMVYETHQAVRIFQLLCSLCPYDFDCWLGLGKALYIEGEFKQALSSFLMSETLNPGCFEAYESAIHCCLELKSYEEAKRILSRCKKHRRSCEGMMDALSLQHSINQLEEEIISYKLEKAVS